MIEKAAPANVSTARIRRPMVASEKAEAEGAASGKSGSWMKVRVKPVLKDWRMMAIFEYYQGFDILGSSCQDLDSLQGHRDPRHCTLGRFGRLEVVFGLPATCRRP